MKRIGLALGSGGWRGLAHIGVIKSLKKHGYSIHAISGSSAGALVGGLYSLWNDIDKVEETFKSLKYQDLLFAFSDPTNGLGFFKGHNTLRLIQKYTKNAVIQELKIPFSAVCTDATTGRKIVFDHGDLAYAIRASSSLPLVFEPVNFNEHLLVDGGITNPLPVEEVKKFNTDIVIAVNIYQCIFPLNKTVKEINKIDLAMISYQLMLNQLACRDAQNADIYLTPMIEHAQEDTFNRFINNQQAIDAGEKAMDEQIETLSQLIV